MSSDEILAASLWSWPDPIVKRDEMGVVQFVNASFLQVYGGRVSDWVGKHVPGWPGVVSGGAQRFETRVGQAPNEIVYDWVETLLGDGQALVISRNVTVYVNQAVNVASAQDIAPLPEQAVQEDAVLETSVQNTQVQDIQVQETPAEAPSADMEDTEAAPENKGVPIEPAPIPPAQTEQVRPERAAQPEPQPELQSKLEPELQVEDTPDLEAEFEEALERTAEDYAFADTQEDQAVIEGIKQNIDVSTQSPTPSSPPSGQKEPAAPEKSAAQNRFMERRALPIEDSTSILGSNWRDQVIAKAVGADMPAPEDTAESKAGAQAQNAKANDDAGTEGQSKMAADLQILLAEDNAINALLTRTLLEAEGAHVDTVEDGALAYDAVQKKDYDLIFMDMRMPNMDGLEATRKIRSWGYNKPIIALTANAFDDDRNACFDSGMNDFMTKPVSAEELSEMVVTWTKKQEEKIAS